MSSRQLVACIRTGLGGPTPASPRHIPLPPSSGTNPRPVCGQPNLGLAILPSDGRGTGTAFRSGSSVSASYSASCRSQSPRLEKVSRSLGKDSPRLENSYRSFETSSPGLEKDFPSLEISSGGPGNFSPTLGFCPFCRSKLRQGIASQTLSRVAPSELTTNNTQEGDNQNYGQQKGKHTRT